MSAKGSKAYSWKIFCLPKAFEFDFIVQTLAQKKARKETRSRKKKFP
jgi:hypothetical protein